MFSSAGIRYPPTGHIAILVSPIGMRPNPLDDAASFIGFSQTIANVYVERSLNASRFLLCSHKLLLSFRVQCHESPRPCRLPTECGPYDYPASSTPHGRIRYWLRLNCRRALFALRPDPERTGGPGLGSNRQAIAKAALVLSPISRPPHVCLNIPCVDAIVERGMTS